MTDQPRTAAGLCPDCGHGMHLHSPLNLKGSYWLCAWWDRVANRQCSCRLAIEAQAGPAVASEGLREADLLALVAAIPGTCDWGGCDEDALLARFDEAKGWLPVCRKHMQEAAWSELAPITAVAIGEEYEARAALASDAGRVGALDVEHTPETPDFDIDVIEGRLVGVWKGTDDRVPFQWQMDMASLIDHYRKATAMLAHVLDRTHDSGCDTCDAARAAAYAAAGEGES